MLTHSQTPIPSYPRTVNRRAAETGLAGSLGSSTRFADIFCYEALPLNKQFHVRLLERPLHIFVRLDENLIYLSKSLRQVSLAGMNSFAFNSLVSKIHYKQRRLLDCIFCIYTEMPEQIKVPKFYRLHLPYEDQAELNRSFSENILFAAQALSSGFRIRDVEHYTDILRGPAEELIAVFCALRFAFRAQCSKNASPPYFERLGHIMHDFDAAWSRFEQQICLCYLNASREVRELYSFSGASNDDMTKMALLFSDTLQYSLDLSYVSNTDVSNREPSLIIGLPRMSLVIGLIHIPEYFQEDENMNLEVPRYFAPFESELKDLRCALIDIVTEGGDLEQFESCLITSTTPDCARQACVYKMISGLVDPLHTEYPRDMSAILRQVFAMFDVPDDS